LLVSSSSLGEATRGGRATVTVQGTSAATLVETLPSSERTSDQ
jgi:hypothetical protein